MEVLRPPPGHRDDEAPSPPRNRFSRFVFALLFLVIGMAVFFIGGIVVRNPELPNYLLDRFVRGFRDAATRSTTTRKGVVSSAENLKPPPPPTTPQQYLNLMSYDERTLPSDERAAATMVDLLVKPPVNWKRDSAGRVVFTTQAMADQYNAASQEFASHIDALNAAFKPFIGG